MTMIDRVVGLTMTSVPAVVLTKTVQDVVLMTMSVPVVDSMMSVRAGATAVSTTVRAAATMTKKNRAVAARVMSARKTRCTTARKPLAKSV
jgi:hypothetical protein